MAARAVPVAISKIHKSKTKTAAFRPPLRLVRLCAGLEAVADLVGPEALEAHQGLVQALEIVVRDAADRLDRLGVLLVDAVDDLVHLGALLGQADAHRAPVDPRAGV